MASVAGCVAPYDFLTDVFSHRLGFLYKIKFRNQNQSFVWQIMWWGNAKHDSCKDEIKLLWCNSVSIGHTDLKLPINTPSHTVINDIHYSVLLDKYFQSTSGAPWKLNELIQRLRSWLQYHRLPNASQIYRKVSNISRNLVGNEIIDHSDVVGASPVGAAPTTSSFSTKHLVSMDWAKTTTRRDEQYLCLGIQCVVY